MVNMPLADLAIPPFRKDLLDLFSFSNQDEHRRINAAIYAMNGTTLPEYVLDPMTRQFEEWLDLHARMHANQNAILGIDGYNLEDVNWEDHSQLEAWTSMHFQEHAAAANILGLT